MAELATVARPYAEAIFQAVQGQATPAPLDQVAAELDALLPSILDKAFKGEL